MQVTIGKLTISDMGEESYWIELEDGEGMQVNKSILEMMLLGWFHKEF